MDESKHIAWTWVRIEIGVGILSAQAWVEHGG
jgi:hypothetical protein